MRCVPDISIIVPVLNEAMELPRLLRELKPWRQHGDEIIVVDAGSTDASVSRAFALCDLTLHSAPERSRQMNLGAQRAGGGILLFLHADTSLGADARAALLDALGTAPLGWGRFDVRISDPGVVFRVIEFLMNLRSRWTGIATGDQGIFVTRALFEKVGGYRAVALMEDVALSADLKRYCAPRCLRQRVGTSARRWREHGLVKTVLLMWLLRLGWSVGAPPALLARAYRYRSQP